MFQEIPKNFRYGYARVSSKSQKDKSYLEAQKQEFIRQGVQKKYSWYFKRIFYFWEMKFLSLICLEMLRA